MTNVLRLHVVDERVWAALSNPLPESTHLTVPDFLHRPLGSDHVQIMGSHANARLIAGLYDLKQKQQVERVQVCSPLAAKSAAAREGAHAAITALSMVFIPPSLGGFHEIQEDDYRSYALAAALQEWAQTRCTDQRAKILRLLHSHPAWSALSFIPTLNEFSCATLLGFLRDPRWYVDPAAPDRPSKMERYMGLDPKTQHGVAMGQRLGHHHDRCQVVLDCWKRPELADEIYKRFEITLPVPNSEYQDPGVAPGDFPWRVWGRYLRIGVDNEEGFEPDEVKADLRASQRFLLFVRHIWVDALYREGSRLPEAGASLFQPRDFFKHPVEIAAFERHQLQMGLL